MSDGRGWLLPGGQLVQEGRKAGSQPRASVGPACSGSQLSNRSVASLYATNSCLLRILRIVVSGELLSSQLASLPPLMEGRQRQVKICSDSAAGL
ncbi:hypothetical protein PAMP_020269 [Pampus punctatissimus]